MPYLTEAEVAATVAEIAAGSGPGSRLVVNFQTPAASIGFGRLLARVLMASTGRSTVWKNEPWRSTWTPAAMGRLLAAHGYAVTRDDALAETAAGLATPVPRRSSLPHSCVIIADRD
ncbi:hypothetical protein GCM10009558_089380 [Virgisporangium aurantiacum]